MSYNDVAFSESEEEEEENNFISTEEDQQQRRGSAQFLREVAQVVDGSSPDDDPASPKNNVEPSSKPMPLIPRPSSTSSLGGGGEFPGSANATDNTNSSSPGHSYGWMGRVVSGVGSLFATVGSSLGRVAGNNNRSSTGVSPTDEEVSTALPLPQQGLTNNADADDDGLHSHLGGGFDSYYRKHQRSASNSGNNTPRGGGDPNAAGSGRNTPDQSARSKAAEEHSLSLLKRQFTNDRLEQEAHRFSSVRDLKIKVCSWNVGSAAPPPDNEIDADVAATVSLLKSLPTDEKGKMGSDVKNDTPPFLSGGAGAKKSATPSSTASSTSSLLKGKGLAPWLIQEDGSLPDIVVVGLQEVEVGGTALMLETTEASVAWMEAVESTLNGLAKGLQITTGDFSGAGGGKPPQQQQQTVVAVGGGGSSSVGSTSLTPLKGVDVGDHERSTDSNTNVFTGGGMNDSSSSSIATTTTTTTTAAANSGSFASNFGGSGNKNNSNSYSGGGGINNQDPYAVPGVKPLKKKNTIDNISTTPRMTGPGATTTGGSFSGGGVSGNSNAGGIGSFANTSTSTDLTTSRAVRYRKIEMAQLVGLTLIFIARSDLKPHIRNVRKSVSRTGPLAMTGNKGSIGIRATILNKRFLFINAHFAAHKGKLETRNSNFQDAMSQLTFKIPTQLDDPLDCALGGRAGTEILGDSRNAEKASSSGTSFLTRMFGKKAKGEKALVNEEKLLENHDYTFFFGDLNYRLTGGKGLTQEAIVDTINHEEYDSLLVFDELRRQQKLDGKAGVFNGFKEAKAINFAPTYKFDVGTQNYDSSKKKRDPAWTDRILYRDASCLDVEKLLAQQQEQIRHHHGTGAGGSLRKRSNSLPSDINVLAEEKKSSGGGAVQEEQCSERGNVLKAVEYNSYPHLLISDHKPIAALFTVPVCAIDVSKAKEVVDQVEAECAGVNVGTAMFPAERRLMFSSGGHFATNNNNNSNAAASSSSTVGGLPSGASRPETQPLDEFKFGASPDGSTVGGGQQQPIELTSPNQSFASGGSGGTNSAIRRVKTATADLSTIG